MIYFTILSIFIITYFSIMIFYTTKSNDCKCLDQTYFQYMRIFSYTIVPAQVLMTLYVIIMNLMHKEYNLMLIYIYTLLVFLGCIVFIVFYVLLEQNTDSTCTCNDNKRHEVINIISMIFGGIGAVILINALSLTIKYFLTK